MNRRQRTMANKEKTVIVIRDTDGSINRVVSTRGKAEKYVDKMLMRGVKLTKEEHQLY